MVSPSGSDQRFLSWEEASCRRLSPIGTFLSMLGVRGRLYLLQQGSPLDVWTLPDSYSQVESPAWSTPGLVFRPDQVGPALVWNPPELCEQSLAGPCLKTVVKVGSPGWSSPGSVFRPDQCDQFWERTYGVTPKSSMPGAWVEGQP